ncbi:hypothetical protein LY28_03756 [Ruminiclostridium sufflavum DSM 19573]|uniref:Uncharacterized protein n=1 Tax=Ruminiclostridium sufflavum DSM 19573 TaxID=1121337 RepID=A0A318XJ84_9FIRM|nr:hypothetical protein LY28_03756 [Ruminiclostridium sufflavum DSM 19573]
MTLQELIQLTRDTEKENCIIIHILQKGEGESINALSAPLLNYFILSLKATFVNLYRYTFVI